MFHHSWLQTVTIVRLINRAAVQIWKWGSGIGELHHGIIHTTSTTLVPIRHSTTPSKTEQRKFFIQDWQLKLHHLQVQSAAATSEYRSDPLETIVPQHRVGHLARWCSMLPSHVNRKIGNGSFIQLRGSRVYHRLWRKTTCNHVQYPARLAQHLPGRLSHRYWSEQTMSQGQQARRTRCTSKQPNLGCKLNSHILYTVLTILCSNSY